MSGQTLTQQELKNAGYFHIGKKLAELTNPRLSDYRLLLKEQPGYAEEDTDPFILRFENPSSHEAPPGALSLRAHDCIHLGFGIGFADYDQVRVGQDGEILLKNDTAGWQPVNSGQVELVRKIGERVLSGIQFGAHPDFKPQHFFDFLHNVDKYAHADYRLDLIDDRIEERIDHPAHQIFPNLPPRMATFGTLAFFQGVALGQQWYKNSACNQTGVGLDLEKFCTQAEAEDWLISDFIWELHNFNPLFIKYISDAICRIINSSPDLENSSAYNVARYTKPPWINHPEPIARGNAAITSQCFAEGARFVRIDNEFQSPPRSDNYPRRANPLAYRR